MRACYYSFLFTIVNKNNNTGNNNTAISINKNKCRNMYEFSECTVPYLARLRSVQEYFFFIFINVNNNNTNTGNNSSDDDVCMNIINRDLGKVKVTV